MQIIVSSWAHLSISAYYYMHFLFRRRLECHQQLEGGITTSVFLYVLFPLIRDDLSIHLWLVVSSERNMSSWAGKYMFNWKLLVLGKMELLFRISLRNNTMCVHCAVFIYQCCKQRSLGRDSRNPLPFPSPKKRESQDHSEVVRGPGWYTNIWLRISCLMRCVISKIATCGISSPKTFKEARLHRERVARTIASS